MLLLLLLSLLTADAPVTQVPFEFTGYHTFIDVEFQGRTLSFVFDTGAGSVGINEVTARRMGIEGKGSVRVWGVGGSMQIPVASNLSLRVGDLQFDGISAGLLPMGHLEERVGRPIDGIIGFDLMPGRVVVLDHDRKVIELHPRAGFPFATWGEPCALGDGLPRVAGEIRLLGGTTLHGDLMIDTGAALFLSVSSPFVGKHELAGRVGATHERTGRALTGVPIAEIVGRIGSLTFCGYEFPPAVKAVGVPTGLSGSTAGVLAMSDSAGLIGNAILKRFNIVLDVDRDRMFLKPNRSWRDPIRYDTSGLHLLRRGERGEVIVDQVVTGSPGAAAGLTPGDRLVSIDGTDIAALTLAALRQRLEEPGKTLRLGTLRDGVPRSVVLSTRSLFDPQR